MTTTQTTPSSPTSAAKTQDSESDSQPLAPPPKLRRRPLLWALGVALIAMGGLGAGWIATTMSDTQSVLALRQDVDRGSAITAEDLVVAQVPGDPALAPVPQSQRDAIIGKTAARDLNAGSLLTKDAFATETIPADGASLVGVALTPAQMPATGVRPGDEVRVVNTPRSMEELPKSSPTTITATVVAVRAVAAEGTLSVVDVTLPTADATELVSLVATGRVGLVLDGGAEQ